MSAEKHGPVVWPDRFWEKMEYYHWYRFGSIHRDDNGFKMWYTSNDTGYNDFLLCYAESEDGIHWEKPDLGLVEYRGSTNNNIVLKRNFWTGKSVWYNPVKGMYRCTSIRHRGDEEGLRPHYSLIERARNSYVEVLESEDGIHWNEDDPEVFADTLLDCHHCPVEFDSDGSGVFLARGPWEDRPEGAELNRRIYRWNFDGERLRNPTHVLDAPGWPEQQLYTMSTVEVDGRYYGFAAVLNVPVERSTTEEEDSDFNSVDCYLAVSGDGEEWEWASDDPIVPRGPPGQWDSGQIYPFLSPLRVEDEIWVYYTGTHSRHGHLSKNEPLVTNQGLARIPVDTLPDQDTRHLVLRRRFTRRRIRSRVRRRRGG